MNLAMFYDNLLFIIDISNINIKYIMYKISDNLY